MFIRPSDPLADSCRWAVCNAKTGLPVEMVRTKADAIRKADEMNVISGGAYWLAQLNPN